nr:reverse transcriptase domain-containing protein [Tanacetum cinerariifolium]
MVPPNNLGPDLVRKPLNETSYRGMIQCKGIASNSCKKNTQVPERKSTSGSFQILGGKLVCWSAKKQQSVAMPQLKLNMLLLLGVVQSTAVAFDPFLSTDEPEKCPLMEFLIKFLVSNRRRPLTLNFKTFYSSTDLDYNNGKYVEHPTHEVVKKELGKISITSSYLDKTLVLKNSFPMAWIILFTFVIQVLGGNYSSIEQVNSIHRLLAYSLITSTEVDVEEIIYSDLVTKLLNKSRLKYVSYPRFISCALQVLQGPDYAQDKKFGFLASILSNSNFTKGPSKVTEIELTAYMIDVNNRMDSVSSPPLAAKPKKMKSQTGTTTHPKDSGGNKQPLDRDITFTTPYEGMAKTTLSPKGSHRDKDLEGNKPPADMEPQNPTDANLLGIGAKYQEDQTQSSRLRMRIRKSSPRHTEASNIDSSSDKILKKYDETLPLTERQLVKYLRKVSCVLFERITKDQWEKHEEAVVHYGSPPAGPPPPQNNNGPPLVVRPNGPAPRSMEELCQPSINGWGGPIALIPIQATDFGLRHHMIQQYMKQNGVFDYALRLSLFPYSLTYHATAWYDRLPRNSIHSFDDMMRKFLSKYFPPLMVTKLKNEIMDFRQKPNESLFEAWERYKLSIDWCPNHNMLLVTQIDMFYNEMLNKNFQEMMKMKSVKSVNTKCETCGGPLSYTECPAIDGYTQEAAYATTANLRGDLKAITTRSGVAYDVHTIPPISPPLLKEVESKTKATKEKTNPKPLISYPLRLNDQKLFEKANNQMMKFQQIFQRLHFDISFADALLHMPKFAYTFKSLLIDYDVDPQVPLILRRPFLRTVRALIDVHEIETFLRTPDEITNLDDDYYDTEGDILYLEKMLNEDHSSNLPLVKNEDLKQVDATMTKPSIKEPPKLELRDLPSHLEYVF